MDLEISAGQVRAMLKHGEKFTLLDEWPIVATITAESVSSPRTNTSRSSRRH